MLKIINNNMDFSIGGAIHIDFTAIYTASRHNGVHRINTYIVFRSEYVHFTT